MTDPLVKFEILANFQSSEIDAWGAREIVQDHNLYNLLQTWMMLSYGQGSEFLDSLLDLHLKAAGNGHLDIDSLNVHLVNHPDFWQSSEVFEVLGKCYDFDMFEFDYAKLLGSAGEVFRIGESGSAEYFANFSKVLLEQQGVSVESMLANFREYCKGWCSKLVQTEQMRVENKKPRDGQLAKNDRKRIRFAKSKVDLDKLLVYITISYGSDKIPIQWNNVRFADFERSLSALEFPGGFRGSISENSRRVGTFEGTLDGHQWSGNVHYSDEVTDDGSEVPLLRLAIILNSEKIHSSNIEIFSAFRKTCRPELDQVSSGDSVAEVRYAQFENCVVLLGSSGKNLFAAAVVRLLSVRLKGANEDNSIGVLKIRKKSKTAGQIVKGVMTGSAIGSAYVLLVVKRVQGGGYMYLGRISGGTAMKIEESTS
ncbi:hypothetical protein [Lentzea sp. NEAU-D7]|uniref:hypothetical protein n=1 Tax=Lentzea sp. NEAU-D7 TaxID=2994667 RepID=UPI00224B006F|nr:hypothetical protein [Lentzea sp. NEAU-D7]MCX2954534.1 hypothetical protein [Lentzea sp. NEAU-D7]